MNQIGLHAAVRLAAEHGGLFTCTIGDADGSFYGLVDKKVELAGTGNQHTFIVVQGDFRRSIRFVDVISWRLTLVAEGARVAV